MIFRVICAGYGRPCPAHAWWYSGAPGAPRKRCHVCAHRVRRWADVEHRTTCAACGEPLPRQRTGRPRLFCRDACRARFRRLAASASVGAPVPPPSPLSAGPAGSADEGGMP